MTASRTLKKNYREWKADLTIAHILHSVQICNNCNIYTYGSFTHTSIFQIRVSAKYGYNTLVFRKVIFQL